MDQNSKTVAGEDNHSTNFTALNKANENQIKPNQTNRTYEPAGLDQFHVSVPRNSGRFIEFLQVGVSSGNFFSNAFP